jgi:hypothetical protein
MWFMHTYFKVDLQDITEIFIDATYNTNKDKTHLYSIVGEETGYGIPLAFMLVEVRRRETAADGPPTRELLNCNKNFYLHAKSLGLYPTFVHTDKDWSEISAATVSDIYVDSPDCRIPMSGQRRATAFARGTSNRRSSKAWGNQMSLSGVIMTCISSSTMAMWIVGRRMRAF